MASTNVEYYEKQKELQGIINTSEQERQKLDQQLKAYFQSDQRLAKLKAVRLHNYWKKICEDEKRSKQRNEQIRREFERIDTHMTSLSSRTEQLCLLKKQYEEEIERTYPNWKELCQAKIAHQAGNYGDGQRVDTAPRPDIPQEVTDPIDEMVKLQMAQIINTKPTPSNITNIRAVSAPHQPRIPPAAASQDASLQTQQQQTRGNQQKTQSSSAQQQQWFPSHGDTKHSAAAVQDSHVPAAAVTTSEAEIGHGAADQSGTPRDVSRVCDTPRDGSRMSYTQSDTPRDASEDAGPLPVQNVSIQKKAAPSTREAEPETPKKAPVVVGSGMQPDDENSDFGSDVELPLGDNTAQKPPPAMLRQRSASGGDDSMSTSTRTFQRGSSFHSSKRWSEYGCVKPELTLEGFLFLLKVVQEDFPEAFATDGYYRSYRPDSAARQEIIHKANSRSDLQTSDPNQVSMVILEQLLLVVRSLQEGCLVSDSLLADDAVTLTHDSIKQRLSLEARSLWDGLFTHFSLLLHHKVMEPKEMAAIFVPCIVEDGSLRQDKAYQLIVRLLGVMKGDDTDDGSSLASPVHQPLVQITHTPAPTHAPAPTPAVNTDGYDGTVPPLKFGSLLEKPMTDDESSSFFSSLPREKMPLNETDAYKTMLSGTMTSQQSRPHDDDDDTDDDVEKQFASVLSPRTPGRGKSPRPSDGNKSPASGSALQAVANFDSQSKPPQIEDDMFDPGSPPHVTSPVYIPTAMQPRSTMNSTGSTQPSTRVAGVKIGSDLDSESDLDILAASRKRIDSEQDDFDFYG